MKLFVTGGAGFIGSNLIRMALASGYRVVNYDAMTYAANPLSLADMAGNPALTFIHGDVRDHTRLRDALMTSTPDAIIHCAAETHVDRSIDRASPFIDTNIVGTHTLLECVRDYMPSAPSGFRLLAVSTDEVFGDIQPDQKPVEADAPYHPSSPYAASKASADHLVRAYARSYALPAIITNCGNNYGPRQFPEKLIPHVILCAVSGKPIPVYGDGGQVRDWIHVDDHNRALLHILNNGALNETYLIGASNEVRNIDIVRRICATLKDIHHRDFEPLITHVKDRPGHDRRYALNPAKLHSTGWKCLVSFETGLQETVKWYLQNDAWIQAAFAAGYELKRQGTGT